MMQNDFDFQFFSQSFRLAHNRVGLLCSALSLSVVVARYWDKKYVAKTYDHDRNVFMWREDIILYHHTSRTMGLRDKSSVNQLDIFCSVLPNDERTTTVNNNKYEFLEYQYHLNGFRFLMTELQPPKLKNILFDSIRKKQ